jgi:hypothetical protein
MLRATLLWKIRRLYSAQNAEKRDTVMERLSVLPHVSCTKLLDIFQLNLMFDGSRPKFSEQFGFYAYHSISYTRLHKVRSYTCIYHLSQKYLVLWKIGTN